MGLATLVRAMEVLGEAQVSMRDAPDPRVNLEVALVRLAHPEADDSPQALLTRIERLESAGRGVPSHPDSPRPTSSPTEQAEAPTAPESPGRAGAPGPRPSGKTLGAVRRQAQPPAPAPEPAADPSPATAPGPPPSAPGTEPSTSRPGRDQLVAPGLRRRPHIPAPSEGQGAVPGGPVRGRRGRQGRLRAAQRDSPRPL